MFNIDDWCYKKDMPRPEIETPFNQNGYLYATNGVVMIRLQENKKFYPIRTTPDVSDAAFPWDHDALCLWRDFKKEMLPEPTYIRCDCGNTTKKHSCPCEDCEGEGEWRVSRAVELPGGDITPLIGDIYLELILTLTDPQYTTEGFIQPISHASRHTPLRFRSKEVFGLVMPMVEPNSHKEGDATTNAPSNP